MTSRPHQDLLNWQHQSHCSQVMTCNAMYMLEVLKCAVSEILTCSVDAAHGRSGHPHVSMRQTTLSGWHKTEVDKHSQ